MFILLSNSILAQELDTIVLSEIEIKSSRISIKGNENLGCFQILDKKQIIETAGGDLGSVLKSNTLVDIRQRSFSGVQSDLSIRGGSFDQNLVLLNGINLSDPQTGHHSLNIPLNTSSIDGVEVVYGPASRIFGPNALTGAINFISNIPDKNGFSLNVSFGSFNTFSTDAGIHIITGELKHSLFVNYSFSDGFIENTNYNRKSIYYENNTALKSVKFKVMAGFLSKDFGSNSFYSPMYLYQFEKIRTGFAALKFSGGQRFKWDYNIYYRGLKDQFQLFREGEGYYTSFDGLWINSNLQDTVSWYNGHNNHFTNVYGSGFNVENKWRFGRSAIGIDYRTEQIYSNVLGIELDEVIDDVYSKSDIRDNLSAFLQHGYYKKSWMINVGGLAYWNQKYDLNFYYGGDVGYRISSEFMVKVGINKAMRIPTFTELYYNGPSNIGNSNLMPESALTVDAGLRYYLNQNSLLTLNLFNRSGQNIIAWVKDAESIKWNTENLTELITRGVEMSFFYSDFQQSFPIQRMWLSYTYLYQDKSSAGLESKYTLDHLRHKMIAGIKHKIYRNISASWSLNMFQRNGEYLYFDSGLGVYTENRNYRLTTLLNCKLESEFKYFDLFVAFNNITNADYFDIANVPTPGFSINGGIRLSIDSKD
jgi:iron complex outermembrane receptor protein